jgi:hypothetical protein
MLYCSNKLKIIFPRIAVIQRRDNKVPKFKEANGYERNITVCTNNSMKGFQTPSNTTLPK